MGVSICHGKRRRWGQWAPSPAASSRCGKCPGSSGRGCPADTHTVHRPVCSRIGCARARTGQTLPPRQLLVRPPASSARAQCLQQDAVLGCRGRGALQAALRAVLGAVLVLLAVPAGPCGRWARGSAVCAGAAVGKGEGSEACSALCMCRQRAGTVTHCSPPACSGTCVGSKRARWAAMPRQRAGRVHGAVP